MSIKIQIELNEENLLEIWDYLVDKKIKLAFSKALPSQIIQDKNFTLAELLVQNGYSIGNFFLCQTLDGEVMEYLINLNKEHPGKLLFKSITHQNLFAATYLLDYYAKDDNFEAIINYNNGKPLVASMCCKSTKFFSLLLAYGASTKYIRPKHLVECIKKYGTKHLDLFVKTAENKRLPYFKKENLAECLILAAHHNHQKLLSILFKNANDIDLDTCFELRVAATSPEVKEYIRQMLSQFKFAQNENSDTDGSDNENI